MTAAAEDAVRSTLMLLANRAHGATICPSEVARALAGADPAGASEPWRDMMPAVHAAIDLLVIDRRIRLSWKGEALASRSGPYRIGRGPLGWTSGS